MFEFLETCLVAQVLQGRDHVLRAVGALTLGIHEDASSEFSELVELSFKDKRVLLKVHDTQPVQLEVQEVVHLPFVHQAVCVDNLRFVLGLLDKKVA